MSGPALAEQTSPARLLRLILLGEAIGIPAALVAAGFLSLVHVLDDLLWTELPDALGASSPPWSWACPSSAPRS